MFLVLASLLYTAFFYCGDVIAKFVVLNRLQALIYKILDFDALIHLL